MIVSRFPLSYSIYCIALKQIIEMFVRKLNLNVSSLQFIICKYVFNQWKAFVTLDIFVHNITIKR